MSKLKLKPCDLCRNLAEIRYRIQYQENNHWVMVCPQCWRTVSLSAGSPAPYLDRDRSRDGSRRD